MDKTYLIINCLVILFPFVLTFEKKLNFYKKIWLTLFGILIVAFPYLIWDSFATYQGDWGFNKNFVTGFKLFNLPIEEVLFFITIPYAILFLYETINYYIPNKTLNINKYLFVVLGALFLFTAIPFINKHYTFIVLIFASLTSILLYFNKLIYDRNYWIIIIFSYIPFFIVNYILTSIPIVFYSDKAILGFRVLTIPIEDFLYSFSLITLNILVYEYLRKQWKGKPL